MDKSLNNKSVEALFTAILSLENCEEAQRFFRDLLTEAELLEFANRWQAAQMLTKKVPYTEIIEKTGLSSATVARISKWLSNGMGGYQLIIDRMKSEKIV